MPDAQEKSEILIDKLLERTLEGAVDWRKTEAEGTFQAAFPSYSVRIWPDRVQGQFGQEDGHLLALFDEEGDLIERIDVVEGEYGSKLSELYSATRRQAMGYDKALDTLIEALG